jgi:two-component system sensor histidine kinase KdpD
MVATPVVARVVRSYGVAVFLIGLVTALGFLAPALTPPDLTMLFLIAIVLASLLGRGPALVAASLAVGAYDFCFVPPRFTLAVIDTHHVLTFVVMFLCGIAISTLSERERRARAAAIDRERRAAREELRSSLLSAVSHDLRTPLAVITGAATTLRDREATLAPAERGELLGSIVDDASRLERVLANLLELSRLDTGVLPARERVPADEVIGASLVRLEPQLGPDIAIDLDVTPDLELDVDPILFEHVVTNLVENAIKHGKPPIAITARPSLAPGAPRTILEVADRGPGVPSDPAEAKRLFEKFVRDPHTTASSGAGLGLAVVRAIVMAHGGDVAALQNPGGGARFRITLPDGPVGLPKPAGLLRSPA